MGRPQLPLPSGPSGLSCRALGTGPVAKGPEDVGLAASATPPGGPHGPLPPNDASHLKAGSETVPNSQKRRGFGTKVPFLGRPRVRPLPSVARRSRVTGVGPRHPRGAVFPHPGFGVRGSLGQSVGFWAVGPKTSAAACGWFCVASNCFCTSVPTFLPALLGFALNLSSSENGVNGRKTFFPLKRRDVCTLTPRAWLCNRGVRCAALGCSGAWGVCGARGRGPPRARVPGSYEGDGVGRAPRGPGAGVGAQPPAPACCASPGPAQTALFIVGFV